MSYSSGFSKLSRNQLAYAKEKYPEFAEKFERDKNRYDNPIINSAHRNIQEEYYNDGYKLNREDRKAYRMNCSIGPHGGFDLWKDYYKST